MADVTEFVTAWASTISTVGLVGVTVWYAFQTQRMARFARESAESSREAAQQSARSASIAAAGTTVNFYVSPLFAASLELDGSPFKGVFLQCSGAAVYVHGVEIEEAWALDPEADNSPSSLVRLEIFSNGDIPALSGLEDTPTLMHQDESIFLEFPRDKWLESDVAALSVMINYSFDARPPLRRRYVEWDTDEIDADADSSDG